MNVNVNYIGKVGFMSEGLLFEPGKPYTVEKELAELFCTMFEVVEVPVVEVEDKPKRVK